MTGEGPRGEPVAPGSRHEIIDIIRGFALFGVLLANMVLTTQYLAITEERRLALPTVTIDAAAECFIGTLIDGKFFTLFSMLFGLGFAVQIARATQRGGTLASTYPRRLGVLLLIGAAHATLLWFGDVLHVYALLGFLLLLYRDRSDRTVLAWAVGLLVLIMCVPVIGWGLEHAGIEPVRAFGREIEAAELYDGLRHGTYADVVRLNWAMHLQDYGVLGPDNILVWYADIFSKFLFGYWVGRRMLLQRAAESRHVFRRVLPWALGLGIAGNLILNLKWAYGITVTEHVGILIALRALHEVWVVSLAIGFACGLVMLAGRPGTRPLVAWLAPMGRMALTNYLVQSVCLLAVFYGIGGGMLGRIGAAGCVGLSVVIFAGQAVISAWWLGRFRFGPAEWVWRSLTYGVRQPLRRDAPRA